MIFLPGILAIQLATAFAQTNPVKVASVARFDLIGNPATGPLTNAYAIAGDVSAGRQNWIPDIDQPRSFTVSFTVTHFSWTEALFRFTPASNGMVTLTLRGPWEQSPNSGPIYRQEVLWDACSATNTTMTNGGFESFNAGVPTAWWRPYGDAALVSAPVQPHEGLCYVRVWHDGPLNCSLSVTGGMPVTLRFFARALFPTNLADMTRISGTNTSAHLAARKFMRGVNLGNYLEAPPGQDWGAHYFATDFVNIRNEGFDHVRIPIGWNYYAGSAPDYAISNSIFPKVDFLVTNALNRGLRAIINIHNWNEFTADPLTHSNEFCAIWRQIAQNYSNGPPELAFELFNEPNGAATTEIINPIYAEAIRQIRLTNPSRIIFVGPGGWNSISELNNLRLPDNDTNLIVTVHCYDPFYFTHQGATWPGPDTATTGVIFPGPPLTPLVPAAGISIWATNWIADYNALPSEGNPSSPVAFKAKLQLARQWSDYYGRPVHFGEFGCYIMADTNSRARFYAEFRSTADALGLGWAMWDWKAGFRYWDDSAGKPAPGMPEAMFPAPRLAILAPGQVQLSDAVGKVFRIERRLSLASGDWLSLQTQALNSLSWLYSDTETSNNTSAFYRAVWLK